MFWTIVVGLVGLVGLGLFIISRLLLDALLEAHLARLRANGFPTSYVELNQYYALSPGERNAASLYEKGAKILACSRIQPRHLPTRWETELNPWDPLPPKWVDDSREFLVQNRKAYELFDEAAELPEAHYAIPMNREQFLPARWSASLGSISALDERDPVPCDAVIEAADEEAMYGAEIADVPLTMKGLRLGFAVQNSLSNVPLPEFYEQRCRLVDDNCCALEHVLNRVVLPDSQLAVIAAKLQEIHIEDGLQRAIAGNRTDLIERFKSGEFENLFNGITRSSFFEERSKPTRTSRFLTWLYQTSGVVDIDELESLNLAGTSMSASTLPSLERQALTARVEKQTEATCAALPVTRDRGFRFAAFDLFDRTDTAVAQIACLRIVVAVERYRLANHDRLPDKLQDLVPQFLVQIPTDPYGGKPIEYIRKDIGYEVGSIHESEHETWALQKNGPCIHSSYVTQDIRFNIQRRPRVDPSQGLKPGVTAQ